MSTASDQRARRIALVVRQSLLMIVAMIEREFGLQQKTGPRIRVEIIETESQEIDD